MRKGRSRGGEEVELVLKPGGEDPGHRDGPGSHTGTRATECWEAHPLQSKKNPLNFT